MILADGTYSNNLPPGEPASADEILRACRDALAKIPQRPDHDVIVGPDDLDATVAKHGVPDQVWLPRDLWDKMVATAKPALPGESAPVLDVICDGRATGPILYRWRGKPWRMMASDFTEAEVLHGVLDIQNYGNP